VLLCDAAIVGAPLPEALASPLGDIVGAPLLEALANPLGDSAAVAAPDGAALVVTCVMDDDAEMLSEE
jgi:hypothetical protein